MNRSNLHNRYIPAGYELLANDESTGVEVWGLLEPVIVAVAFGGKRSKPDWHYRFASKDRLTAKIDETIKNAKAYVALKAQRRAERSAPHDVKVGDVFLCSWGYEQTNIDYYECTKVLGAMIEIREIGCESVDTLFMQGKSVPSPGKFIGEPMRKKVRSYPGCEPSVSIASYASATRLKPAATIGGARVYEASHWTAYA